MSAAVKIPKQIDTHGHKHDHGDHHDCATCHEHNEDEKKTGTSSLTKKIHEKNGHQCIDPHCDIEAPHGHNHIKDQQHDHKAHDHHHDHDHHKFPFWPLENFIAHAKIPQWLREFSLNASFLSPAMITSTILDHIPMPKLLKTWISITAMHLFNRGKEKLPRLGLTYLISGAASAGAETSLGSRLSRFLATSAVAFVEKFSSNGHHHGKESTEQMIKREIGTLAKNLKSKKQWIELLPSLINIEAKVQLIAPLVSMLVRSISSKFSDTTKAIFNTASSIILTSLSFVGTDKALTAIAKTLGGENSSFAASLSSVCGCCGSPVCSAAATDTALSNAM